MKKKHHKTIKERIAEYNEENIDLKEFEFGQTLGKELWLMKISQVQMDEVMDIIKGFLE